MAGGRLPTGYPVATIFFEDENGEPQPVTALNPLPTSGGGGGGGGGSSLADSSVVDAAGVYWLVRDNGTTLTYRNWATGATGTPTAPVQPVGAGAGRQVSSVLYNAIAAGTGYAIGDVLERTVVLDIAVNPAVVLGSTWVNVTTGAVLGTAPSMGDLVQTDDNVAATMADGANVSLGARADAAAGSDTGTFSLISLFKRLLQSTTSLVGRLPAALEGNRLAVNANNFSLTWREPFVAFPGTDWLQPQTGTGDIVGVDGNAAGASYLVLSKNPLDLSGGESWVESSVTFAMPIEMAIGAHLSQRTLGQEFSVEVVSTEDPGTPPAELAISAIQQATTTLTVTTATAHNLKVGSRIGIYGVTGNSALNYSELVVATTPSATQFTCTAGPQGNIPSVTSGPFAQGFVYARSAMGFSPNGTSMIFENATATQASFYTKSDNGDPMPVGGTLGGNHSATVATTASVQAANAFATYAFRPTSEYRLAQMADRLQWHDATVDATGQTTARATVTQVIPNNGQTYKLRFRAKNHKSLTAPVAKIVSAAKTGTTTATIVTDVAHGLTTGDVVNIYGIRDQAASSFPNLTAATAVASVVNATTFTIVIGTAATVTSYGGYVSRVNGGQVQQGAIAQAVQSATIASSVLTLVGSAAWSGLLIGDYVNAHGLRRATDGSDLGIDGVYRVRDIQTTNLVLEPIGTTSIPATLGTTNCGGAILKRTDLRVSFVRLFDFDRLRVEALNRPTSDAAGALPVVLQGGTLPTVTNLSQIGGAAPNVSVANGSANRSLSTSQATAVAQVDVNAAAFAGAGRVNGTVIASAQGGGAVISAEVNVSALTLGTATGIVLVLQESRGGSNFTDIWTSRIITATGIVSVPPIAVGGRRRWAVHSIGGTSTTVTVTVNTNELPTGTYPLVRSFRDAFAATNPFATVFNNAALAASTLVLTTGNSTTTPFLVEGCKQITAFMTLTGGVPTTQPVLTLELSMDGTNWWATGTTLTATGAGVVMASLSGATAKFARLRVSTASAGGTAYTLGEIGIEAVN